jgi:DNA-binding transcriptional LysR family regulator
VVLVLAEELHFGRAAARLHVVQSAVSQTLKDLEDELGTELFARNRRGVALTAAGVHFRDHARRAIEAMESGAAAAQRAGMGEEGRLRIVFSTMATLTPLPRVVAAFARQAPLVQIELEQHASPTILEMLLHGEADVGVLPEIERYGALSFSLLTSDSVVAVLPSDHKLAKAQTKNLKPADFDGEPMVRLSARAEPVIKSQLATWLSEHKVQPKVVYEFDQIETLLSLVAAGLAVSLAPSAVSEVRHRNVVYRPITPRMIARHFVVWDEKPISAVARRFLHLLQSSGGAASRSRDGTIFGSRNPGQRRA